MGCPGNLICLVLQACWVDLNNKQHGGVKGNDRADRLAGKATLTSGLLLRRFEVLKSLRHHLRAQSQGHRTIDRLEERGKDIAPSIAWRREARTSHHRSPGGERQGQRKCYSWMIFLERTREGYRQSDEH